MIIKIGSRDSLLAVAQSDIVIDALNKAHPEIQTQLITMKTTGDIILDKTLDKVGGKGLFVKELDRALLNKEVDLTVHSYKDVPMEVNPLLPIVAVSKREDPRDVLILPKGTDKLDLTKPIGCSSLRRKLQLESLFEGAKIAPIRGNVQTRLQKLDRGDYSAIVLAYAGIKRLGLEERISRIFEISEILPAACQGILAVQGRKDFDSEILKDFNDENTYFSSLAERSFVKTLDGGCSAPFCAYAEIKNDEIELTGFYVDGRNNFYKKTVTDKKENAVETGRSLAVTMRGEYGNG